jgi:histidinol-phosphate aminotransferase
VVRLPIHDVRTLEDAFRLPIHEVRTLEEALRLPVFAERERSLAEGEDEARAILSRVRSEGDRALRELTRRFDHVELDTFRVPERQLRRGADELDRRAREALDLAAERIRRFHERTAPERMRHASDGLEMWREFRPVSSAALYVPGGRAAYPSTVLMLGIPACIAGVPRIALATPPRGDGTLPAAVLVAAELAGITEIYRIGGAQAIAALAYGTETIPPVDLIVGPGNRFVTAAKRLVYGRVRIDGLAGPSEIAIVADGSSPARWAALDVLAQLEHDPDARALVTATDPRWLDELADELSAMAPQSPRAAVLRTSIAASAGLALPDLSMAMSVAGAYAPEHLALLTTDPRRQVERIEAAGAIFLGPFAPVALGDYLAGPNHTLPTGGTARAFSGVDVEMFGRWVSVVEGNERALASLLAPAALLAELEGLPGHAASLRARARNGGAASWPADRSWERSSGVDSVGGTPPLSRRAQAFTPYRAARHEALSGILLDANEHPSGGFRETPDLSQALADLGRYPDPSNARVRASAAGFYGVPADCVFAGNGSDEAIDLVFRAWTDPGDEILVASPTYGMYAVQAALHGVDVHEVPLTRDFTLDPAAVLGSLSGRSRSAGRNPSASLGRGASRLRILFLCSPNNPTGNLLGRHEILETARIFPGLVVVDEAYVEFAGVESLASDAVRQGSNLLVLRTLSKAFGLAGLRAGFALGSPEAIEALQRVKLPYNLSGMTTALAEQALADTGRLERNVREVTRERSRVAAELHSLGLTPLPSDANFLLIPHTDAPAIVRRLAARDGIVIRDRSGLPGIAAAFRVTVGSPSENDRFLEGLARCV